MAQNSSSPSAGSNPLLVIVYWAIVAVPLGWGVYKTVQKSIPLFTGAAAPAAATPAPKPSAAPSPVPSPESSMSPSATVAPMVTPAAPTN